MFQQADLRDSHRRSGIATHAWSPLGHGGDLADPVVTGIAHAHDRAPAQVVLRWLLQLGVLPVVKANSAAHMAQNLVLDDFVLSDRDMAAMGGLDRGESCFGVDPRTLVAPEGIRATAPEGAD